MRNGRRGAIAGLVLAGTIAAAPLAAQEAEARVLSSDDVWGLVTERADQLDERRSALQDFLAQPAVQKIARSAGIEIGDVESAASTLTDEQIERLDPALRDAEDALAGGDTLVISSTAIIIGLLVIILIVVA